MCCEEEPTKRLSLQQISEKIDEIQEKTSKVAFLDRHFREFSQMTSKMEQKVKK